MVVEGDADDEGANDDSCGHLFLHSANHRALRGVQRGLVQFEHKLLARNVLLTGRFDVNLVGHNLCIMSVESLP